MAPHQEYTRRLADRLAGAEHEEKRSRRIGNARLATALAAVAIAYFVFGVVSLAPWWLIPPALLFSALAITHARVEARLRRARRAADFYRWGLARIENRWAGRGETGERFQPEAHVYAADLDLFGAGSLFELLCAARTDGGRRTLAAWLLAPAGLDDARARQKAVDELRPRLDLREDFAVLGEAAGSGAQAEAAARWGEAPAVRFQTALRAAAAAISAGVAISFALYMAGVFTRTPFIAAVFAALLFAFSLRGKVDEITAGVESPARDLHLIAALLARLEREPAGCPALRALLDRIGAPGARASARIAALYRLTDRLEWEHNLFFKPIATVLLWRPQLAMALEAWRAISGTAIRRWIAAVAEFEALLSIAAYAYEHPDDPFPELEGGEVRFHAAGLGHPLLSAAECVRNDVRLDDGLRLLVISGSNMSGKSTLLRSAGLGVVLAWAGAPVRAERMSLSPLAVGASIRVTDSLQDGRSRFYAEITRLREIVDLTKGPRPALFLIDELLSGTNSHDRRIGAEAVARSLAGRGAIGMITTHDLALADIAENFGGRAANVHFADAIVDGQLHFDYRLRAGVVERSNALELMRSVGLEV